MGSRWARRGGFAHATQTGTAGLHTSRELVERTRLEPSDITRMYRTLDYRRNALTTATRKQERAAVIRCVHTGQCFRELGMRKFHDIRKFRQHLKHIHIRMHYEWPSEQGIAHTSDGRYGANPYTMVTLYSCGPHTQRCMQG